MAGLLDSQQIDITCPQCKSKVTKAVRDLKRSGTKCPNCGTGFETSQFKREMDKVDRSIQDFQRSLKDIKINIKL